MGLYVERTSAEMVRMTLEERRLIVSQRYDLGLSADEIAKLRKLDRCQVYRVLRKWKLHGTVENRPRHHHSLQTSENRLHQVNEVVSLETVPSLSDCDSQFFGILTIDVTHNRNQPSPRVFNEIEIGGLSEVLV